MKKSIASIILTFTFTMIFFLTLFVSILFYIYLKRIYIEDIKKDLRVSSNQIFSSMYQIMKNGWKRSDVLEFIASLEASQKDGEVTINLFRSPKVIEKFGSVPEAEKDQYVQTVMETKKRFEITENKNMYYLKPLIAQKKCLSCHSNAKEGDLLGVLEIKRDLSEIYEGINKIFMIFLIILIPSSILLSYLLAIFFRKRFTKIVITLRDNIRKLEKLKDLDELNRKLKHNDIQEIDDLTTEMNNLSQKIQSIATDKEILELEIQLTEKLIITSDVVKEWREYVKYILLEVSIIINVNYLFTMFIENNQLIIEIFWLGEPTDEIKNIVEKQIRKSLLKEDALIQLDLQKIFFNHNICSEDKKISSDLFKETTVQNKTKKIILEKPKVGSIVGLGINSKEIETNKMELAIQSVLATLINVVGSAKAISTYISQIEFYAMRDPLTYLYNQRIFWELLGYEIERAKRNKEDLSLLFMDLDNFKYINDTYGHSAGDLALKEIARILNETKRSGDIAVRYGGDEFVLILTKTDTNAAYNVAERIRKNIESLTISLSAHENIKLSLSIGVASFPYHGTTPKDLFLVADAMAAKAKKGGKNQIAIPEYSDIVDTIKTSGTYAMFLIRTLENKDITPFFQPIVNLQDGSIHAYEALMRLGNKHTITEKLIETAEHMGLVQRFDRLMIEKTFEQIKKQKIDTLVSLNLSVKDIISKDFKKELLYLIKKFDIEPSKLIFELTERDSLENMEVIRDFITLLKDIGASFAIDDMGSGYASFKYLKEFNADYVKIDGEFVKNILTNSYDETLVKSIVHIAKTMEIQVIAEYVENRDIFNKLKDMDVEYAQGYYFGKPQQYIKSFHEKLYKFKP